MPTRVLLEGAALEPLLAQVREEYGPTARIVSAEKVRSGGLGGFFARQRYELAVEIDDVTAEPDGAPEAGGAAETGGAGAAPVDNLLALVEASQDRYRDLAVPAEPAAPARKPRRPGARSTGAQPRPWIAPELPAAAPAGATAQDGVQAAARAAAQTAAQAAQAALAAQEAQTGAQAAQPAAPAAQPATPAAQTAVPARAGLVSTTGAAFAEVMAGLQGGLAPAPEEDSAPILVSHRRSNDGGIPRSAPGDVTEAAGTGSAGAAAGNGTATPEPRPDSGDTGTDTRTGRSWTAELVALGMPEHLAERATGDDPYQAIMLALGDLPVPPAAPDQRGDVLVIAGELALAMPVAEKAARDLHLDPSKIMVAGPTTAGTGLHASRRISGPAEAQRRARKLHHEEVPHVVVVDVAMPAAGESWAREVCDALGATAVWAIVDATRKTADVARHLRALGDVDGILVHGLAATGDPASVLALPAAVVSLDGQPATARAWAALLSERLVPAGRPAPRGRRGRPGRS